MTLTAGQSKRWVGALSYLRTGADAAHTMPPRSDDVFVSTMAKGLAGAARGAAAMTASVARHAAWYLRYRVDGNSRAHDGPSRRRG